MQFGATSIFKILIFPHLTLIAVSPRLNKIALFEFLLYSKLSMILIVARAVQILPTFNNKIRLELSAFPDPNDGVITSAYYSLKR